MEIQELKELALIFKEAADSKRKSTLDIFYNVENCAELLCSDTLSRYTPTYKTKTDPPLSFRGSIEKSDENTLKVGLRNVSSEGIVVHAKWTFSVYNRNTEEYQLISKLRMNVSSFKKVTKFPVQLSDLQHLIHENVLLLNWNIEILSSPPGQAKERSPDFINEVLDTLFETLSVDKHNESEKLKTLFSVMEVCQDGQIKNDHKLQTIEQNVFDINHRLTAMLSNINVKQERFLQEIGFATHHSAQTIPTDQSELRSEMRLTLEEKEDTSTTRYSTQHETKTTRKLLCNKETQTDGTFSKIVEPRYKVRLFQRYPDFSEDSSSEESSDELGYLERIEYKQYKQFLKKALPYKRKIEQRKFSPMGNYSPRLKEEDYLSAVQTEHLRLRGPKTKLEVMPSSDMLAHKRILFLGCDIELMRAILCQFKNSEFWMMSDKKELQLMQCEDEGIYFYCGCVSRNSPESDMQSLMRNSEKYKAHGFHACVIVIRTNLDIQILDIFDARFLRQFCLPLVSNDVDFTVFEVKDIVRFDWFTYGREILKKKLEPLSTEQFQFDRRILKMSQEQTVLKEVNEFKEKCLLFRDFLRSKKYRNIAGHEIQPLTLQIRSLLLECEDILLKTV